MLSQFWFGFAATAVLVCVCVGTLLQKRLRTGKEFWSRGALWFALAFSAAQTAASGISGFDLPVAVWVPSAVQALACALAPAAAFCLVMSEASRVRAAWWKERHIPYFLPLPAVLCAAGCAGFWIWSATQSDAVFPAASLCVLSAVVSLVYAVMLAASCFPIPAVCFARAPLRELAAAMLAALGIAAGSVCALCTPFGMEAMAAGACCAVVLFCGVNAAPSVYRENESRIYSRAAFHEIVQTYFDEQMPFTCTAVVIPQLALLMRAVEPQQSKQLNETVGTVLRRAARRSAVYRVADSVFVIVDKGSERREQMMAELETRFEQPWLTYGRLEMRFVKIYAPQDCADAAGLVRVLRELVFRAARAGSPMLVCCDDAMQAVTARRKAVSSVFAAALQTGEFEVVFQPIYTPRVHQVTAAKAYVRVRHEELGEIGDEELRFAAKEAHAELRFGTLLFDRICASVQQESLFSTCVQEIYVSLTPHQWMRCGLADELVDIARKHGLDMKHFVFEASAECIRDDGSEFFANADRLFAFGSRYALGGFGTDECNLVRLLSLDVKTIKLDKELVWSYCRGETTVPDYLAPLFASKGKLLIAEGIETKRHADAMTKLGCTSLQGYYYARPMPAAELVSYVSSATSAWEHFVREHEEQNAETDLSEEK